MNAMTQNYSTVNVFSYVVYASGTFAVEVATAIGAIAIPISGRDLVHKLKISDLRSPKVRLKKAIDVVVRDMGDHMLAEFPDAGISVSEDTAAAALDWLRSTIEYMFITFSESKDNLGPFAMKQLKTLEGFVVEMPHSRT